MLNHTKRTGIAVAACVALLAPAAVAQVPLTARALGMGGAYVGMARGHESLFLNPANLGLAGNPRWSLAFPQFGFGSTLVGPELTDFNRLRNYDDLQQSELDAILATIPGEGTEVGIDIKAPIFSLQTRRFGFGVAYGNVGGHTLGRDFVDLLFNGYDDTRTDYRVGNTAGNRATYLDFVAAYGQRIGPVSLGVAAHYIRGLSLVQSRLFEPRFDVAARNISVDYVGVASEGGTGYGLDVGAALQPIPNLTISAAVANAFARMDWSDNLRLRQVTFDKSDFAGTNAFELLREYERSDRAFDAAAAPLSAYAVAEGLFDEAYFPTTLKTGIAYQIAKTGTGLSAAYHTNLTEGRLAGEWDDLLGVGIQQKLLFLTLRGGYSTNLASGDQAGDLLSAGLSLGPLELGVGRYTTGQFDGVDRRGLVGTFGVNVRTKSTMK